MLKRQIRNRNDRNYRNDVEAYKKPKSKEKKELKVAI